MGTMEMLGVLFVLLISKINTVQGQSMTQIVAVNPNTTVNDDSYAAILTCRTTNLGTYKVDWVFLKHGSHPIVHGDKILIQDDRFSLITAQDNTNQHQLMISYPKVQDQGVYKCQISGTTQAATIHLIVGTTSPPPNITNPGAPLNRTGCCIEKGVQAACLPACQPSTAPQGINFPITCAADLFNLIDCGSDDRNHEYCCALSGLPTHCLMFCNGDHLNSSQVTDNHLSCLNYVNNIISCFEFGSERLPTPPQQVSVIQVQQNVSVWLSVSWKPPQYNAQFVTGYSLHYKRQDQDQFQIKRIAGSNTLQYSISGVQLYKQYTLFVVATAADGASQASENITVYTQDRSSSGSARNIRDCCSKSSVSSACLSDLCTPRTWTTFNVTVMLKCYDDLPAIFSCLAGERDNQLCCSSNSVPSLCLDLCASGAPPPFNASLGTCVPYLPVIEACIQQGLLAADGTQVQPLPPQSLKLERVQAHSALLTWAAPNASNAAPVIAYYVQLRRGDHRAPWLTLEEVVGTSTMLTNLTESETYAVRVIAKSSSSSSLPSYYVRFKTYSEVDAPLRPTVVHNLTDCCMKSGMPQECALGCQYQPNMTMYYASRLGLCAAHIGTVLTCAADGGNHTQCCRREEVTTPCLPMCVFDSPGPVDNSFLQCILDTAKILKCFKEGVVDNLVRKPDNVAVNETSHTLTVTWQSPNTGPQPTAFYVQIRNQTQPQWQEMRTEKQEYIFQNLLAASAYTIRVVSYWNNTRSPPTRDLVARTLPQGVPPVPAPTDTSRVLWSNRTACCSSSVHRIPPECQPACLNRFQPNGTDCSAQAVNIMACAADGKDHSQCCRAGGLPEECISICSGNWAGSYEILAKAGCLASFGFTVITSCFEEAWGVLPSEPQSFTTILQGMDVVLSWNQALNCAGADQTDTCTYDAHYWPADDLHALFYTTVPDVKSPYTVTGLDVNTEFTFTVTARNSRGTGRAAPWHNAIILFSDPVAVIAQDPKLQIFSQGNDVSLVCKVYNYPTNIAPRLQWFLRDRRLPSTSHVLSLPDLKKTSEGNYTCQVMLGSMNISAQSYLNVRFKPEFNYFRTDSVPPNQGAEAVLACWFRGHPDIDNPGAVWTKDGQPIDTSDSRLSATAKSRYHTGITPFKLKIANLVPSDYGLYQCKVSNQYGFAMATTKLIDPDKQPTPFPPSPAAQRQLPNCCQAKDVPDRCMPICTGQVSMAQAAADPLTYSSCLLFIKQFIECASDGADHSLCCEDKVVKPACMPFCAGSIPDHDNIFDAAHLLQCVEDSQIILDCMEKGYERIPTAPRNLVASFTNSKIKLAWDAPQRNPDKVTSYNVYYNFTGRPQYYTETITAHIGQLHTLLDVDPNHVYHVWMTAESYKNGRSQPTPIISVSTRGSVPMAPTGVSVTGVSATTATITWTLPSDSSREESFGVHYKRLNDANYQTVSALQSKIILSNLKPKTDYTAYLTSRNSAGESVRSQTIRFTTSEESSTPITSDQTQGLTGTQTAGIIIAVITIILVIAVLAFFVIRSRRNSNSKLADTVAFENPSYGEQQVQIGHAAGINACDSTMQPIDSKDGDFNYARMEEERMSQRVHKPSNPPVTEETPGGGEAVAGAQNNNNSRDGYATLEVSPSNNDSGDGYTTLKASTSNSKNETQT